MQQVTQRVAANSQESAAAGEELAAQAQNLHSIVERLRGLLGAIADGPAHPDAGPRPATDAVGVPVSIANRRSSSDPARVPTRQPAAPVSGGRNDFPLDDNEFRF
jgi:hypothetical protein